MSSSILNILFEGESVLTGNIIKGYYVKEGGNDFIIDSLGKWWKVKSVRLIYKNLESLLQSISDYTKSNEGVTAVALFKVLNNGKEETAGTIAASVRDAVDMLYSWGCENEKARRAIILTATKLFCAGDCMICANTDCANHPANIAAAMFPFIGTKGQSS